MALNDLLLGSVEGRRIMILIEEDVEGKQAMFICQSFTADAEGSLGCGGCKVRSKLIGFGFIGLTVLLPLLPRSRNRIPPYSALRNLARRYSKFADDKVRVKVYDVRAQRA